MLLGLSRIHFIFIAGNISLYGIYHSLFTYSPADGHLGHLQVLALTSKASVNMPVQDSVCKYVFISLGYLSRSGMTGS